MKDRETRVKPAEGWEDYDAGKLASTRIRLSWSKPSSNRELATKIAEALFVNSDKRSRLKAVRLQIKLGWREHQDTESEKDGGGWCFKAAVNQIERVLNEHVG